MHIVFTKISKYNNFFLLKHMCIPQQESATDFHNTPSSVPLEYLYYLHKKFFSQGSTSPIKNKFLF